jgi:5''-3'' exonuclease (including N-terminal domain of PolI)
VLPCYKENRNRATPEYKAVREQIEIFVELLTGIGVKQARYDSFEADDLAGAYAAAALEHGNSVVLISGDKDWLQLLGPKVKQLRGWVGSKGDWWDVARMKIEHGMGVEDWPRYLSLIGDKGDNIPKALSGRRGPVVAKAIIAGEQELLPEEQAQYDLNFKVIKINPTLADRKLKSTLVKPNRGEAGWQHLQDTLKEYELVQLWEDRRRIWQVGAW